MIRVHRILKSATRHISMSAIRMDASASVPFASATSRALGIDKLAGASSGRHAPDFTKKAIEHPASKLIVFVDLSPVCERGEKGASPRMARFSPGDALDRLGVSPGAIQDSSSEAPAFNVMGKYPTTSSGEDGGFLIAVEAGSLPSVRLAATSALLAADEAMKGAPIKWNSRNASKACIQEVLERLQPSSERKLHAQQPRTFMLGASAAASSSDDALEELQLMGMARAVLQWHGKTGFCSECGGRTAARHGGAQRVCVGHPAPPAAATAGAPASDAPAAGRAGADSVAAATPAAGIPGCGATHYPRTDPVVIAAVLSPDLQHVLLGRQKAFPPGMYSCLAGFLDPCETVEEGVRREVLEEAGVVVGAVQVVQSQPWPVSRGAFGQVMLGCVAVALPSAAGVGEGGEGVLPAISVDEEELETAQWVPLGAARGALDRGAALTSLPAAGRGSIKPAAGGGGDKAGSGGAAEQEAEGGKAPGVDFLPGPYAIAHHLVHRAIGIGAAVRQSGGDGAAAGEEAGVAAGGFGESQLRGWLAKF